MRMVVPTRWEPDISSPYFSPSTPETSQLVTRSTRHTVKSCDELTVVSDGVVTS